ncbi:MAG: hypothetical protein KA419_17530 [Acidobacteria bacterium]|nr:hypothetical protein [Acidobacteriota bacterium]
MLRMRWLRGLAALALLLALAGWAPAVVRPWTVMVQFTGPPESSPEVEGLLQDLLNGVTENVHLVIQTNYPILPGESGGKGVYVGIPGSGGRPSQYVRVLAQPGLDLGSPDALSTLFPLVAESYPADRYALVLGHEAETFQDAGFNPFARVLRDQQTGHSLALSRTNGMGDALDLWQKAVGRPLDLLCLTTPCQMTWETCAELAGKVRYLAAAPGAMPGARLLWGSVLYDLSGTLTGSAAGERFADAAAAQGAPAFTVADLNPAAGLQAAVSNLAAQLIQFRADGGDAAIATARSATPGLGIGGVAELADLADFLSRAQGGSLGPPVASAAAAVSAIWQQAIVHHALSGNPGYPASISIYFPPVPAEYDAFYDTLPLSAATQWDAFLKGQTGLEVGDHVTLSTGKGLTLVVGDSKPVVIEATITAVNGVSDTATLSGGITFPGGASISFTGLGVRYSHLLADGSVSVTQFPTVQGSIPSLQAGVFSLQNVLVWWDGYGIHLRGQAVINGASLAGLGVSIRGTLSLGLTEAGSFTPESTNILAVNCSAGCLSFQGSATLLSNPYRMSVTASGTLCGLGSFQVTNLVAGFDGTIQNYGQVTFQSTTLDLGPFNLSNVSASWNAAGLHISGSLTVSNLPIGGLSFGFSCAGTATVSLAGGSASVTALQLGTVNFSNNGLSFTGNGSYKADTQRITLNGTLQITNLFTCSVSGLTVGMSGTVHSFGTVTVSVPSFTVQGISLKNLQLTLSATQLKVQGSVQATGIPLAGGSLALSASADAIFKMSATGASFYSLTLSEASLSSQVFTSTGSITLLSNPTRFRLNGTLNVQGHFQLCVKGLEITPGGTIVSYGTLSASLPFLNVNGFILSGLQITLSGTQLSVSGGLALTHLTLAGTSVNLAASGSSTFKLINGAWQITAFAVTGLSGGYGDFSFSGSATALANPSRLSIDATIALGGYGHLHWNDLVVGQNGTVYSFGSLGVGVSEIKAGPVTFSNLSVTLGATRLTVSGGVSIAASNYSLGASGVLKLNRNSGSMQVESLTLTGLSGSFMGFSFSGGAVRTPGGGLDLSGSIAFTNTFQASVEEILISSTGTVTSVKAVTLGVNIGQFGFKGSVAFPAVNQVRVEGAIKVPAFLAGSSAGGMVHLKRHPGGGVLNCGWDILAGSISIPSFKIGGYSFGGASFTCDAAHVAGAASLGVPNVGQIAFNFDIGWDGSFRGACLKVTGMQIQLGYGLILNGAGGCVRHYTSPSNYWEVELEGLISYANILYLDSVLTVSTNGYFKGVGTLEVYGWDISSTSFEIDIPHKMISIGGWLGTNPDKGLDFKIAAVKAALEADFHWGADWYLLANADASLEVLGKDLLGASGALAVHYNQFPYPYGGFPCERLDGNGLAVSGHIWNRALGAKIWKDSKWHVKVFTCKN